MSDHVDKIRDQFGRQARAYADTAQASDDAAHAALVALCEPAPDARVLDVACGPGALTLAFAARCGQAVGLDATTAMLQIARERASGRGAHNVRFEHGDATALPFADGAFDLAVCRAAFHHFPEPGCVLSEMARVVRPGGKVVVADFATSDDPAEAEQHNAIERLCDPSHTRALTRDELRALFRAQGLELAADLPRRMHYELDEWIAHGGPAPAHEAEIRRRFEQALTQDRTGLAVRRDEQGKIRFTHQTLLLVGQR
jgi:ubiquinone/menaquinone biosynthesis C-methylase UbiE